MLREEVAVNYLYQAVELLDREPAHGNVQDEFSKEFATHKGRSKNINLCPIYVKDIQQPRKR